MSSIVFDIFVEVKNKIKKTQARTILQGNSYQKQFIFLHGLSKNNFSVPAFKLLGKILNFSSTPGKHNKNYY